MPFGEATAEEPLVGLGVEQGGFEAEGSESIAVGLGGALNQTVEAQAAQVRQRAVGLGQHRVMGVVLRRLRRTRPVPVSEQHFGHLPNTPVSASIISAQNGIRVNENREHFRVT